MPSQYEKIAHLLRRAAFGARPDEIDNFVKQGLEATVDQLVNYEQVAEDPSIPAEPAARTAPPAGAPNITMVDLGDVSTWWLNMMLRTRQPLRERMVLFWHDHFATSAEKITPPNGHKHLYWQNQLERQYATGNFRAFCKAMNRDPAMLRWLDNVYNTKGSPNENYARELFEIFMLGFDAFEAGGYTEPDVQQAARAFTGWGINLLRLDGPIRISDGVNTVNGPATDPSQVVLIPPATNNGSAAANNHDYNNKTVFTVVSNFNGDDIVDIVLDRSPQKEYAARMLGKKIFEHFAYENPEQHIVDHLAAVLLRTNFNVKALLRDLFLNVKEFYSEKAFFSIIKTPAYYLISTLRLLGMQSVTLDGRGAENNTLRAMGQQLFWPPDVFGWPGREDWITTSQYFARANWANTLVTFSSTDQRRLSNTQIEQLLSFGGLGAAPTAEQVVDYFTQLLAQRPFAANVRQTLVDYLKKNNSGVIGTYSLATDKTSNYRKTRGLLHLLLARPEYQNH
jgi:uncharacterized protein (DUF1800 family)